MKALVTRLRPWWAARSPRERLLAIGVTFTLAVALLDVVLLAPAREDSRRAQAELTAARHALGEVQKLIEANGSAQPTPGPQAALLERRTRAQAVLDAAQVHPLDAQAMRAQLTSLLAGFPQLRVVGLASSAPTPMATAPGGRNALYQHGLELTLEGRYLDVMGYLDALERGPHKLYWRELDMQTQPDGRLVTRVALFALSREATWLKL